MRHGAAAREGEGKKVGRREGRKEGRTEGSRVGRSVFPEYSSTDVSMHIALCSMLRSPSSGRSREAPPIMST